jgi:dTDP-D-glucose 4,6-dehydratase
MRKTFNWKDTISLDEGIKDTIEWVEKNYSYFSNIPWNYLHRL